MARSCINRDIHFSQFEMVYGNQLEIQEKPRGLKLVEPTDVLLGESISPELKLICNKASEQGSKRACEQAILQTEQYKINNEVWALNHIIEN